MSNGISAARGVRLLLATVLLLSAFTVAGAAAVRASATSPAGRARTGAARVSAVTTSCADVLFVGARGSGEAGPGDRGWKPTTSDPYGLGGTVESARRRLAADLGLHRTMQVESVSYVANGVQTLVHAPRQYFANLAVGVTWTMGVLGGQARKCPAQQIVLAGFSQGAMVMHRALHDLGATASGRAILARVAAAILVGDGDQVPHDNEVIYGTAGAGADGIGHLLPSISHTSSAKFPASMTAKLLRVCWHHDPVCDATEAELNPIAFRIHLSYPGSKPLLGAADQAALDVRDMPAAPPASVTGYLGTALRYQLRADVAAGCTLQWKAAPGTRLPSGLTLNGTGLIAGTPVAAGRYTTALQVRAVRAKLASPWLPASVTITVTVKPPGNWKATALSLSVDSYPVSLDAVSCPTTTFCIAVGNYFPPEDYEGYTGAVATWSDGAWSAVTAPLPGNAVVPSPTTGVNGTESYLNAVSCPTVSYCVAVGQYSTDVTDPEDGLPEVEGFLLRFSGGAWTAAEVPGADTAANPDDPQWGANLLSVSCPSASFCATVGDVNGAAEMLTSAGGAWRAVDMDGLLEDLFQVSCASSSYCMATDTGGAASWSNGVWKQLTLPAPASADQPSYISGENVACPAAGQCVVSGEYEDIYGYHWPVYRFSGGTWTVDLADLKDYSNVPACPAVADCAFPMGQSQSGSQPNPDFVYIDADGTWPDLPVEPPAGGIAGDYGGLASLACPSAAECLGIGEYTSDPSRIDGQGMFVTFTP